MFSHLVGHPRVGTLIFLYKLIASLCSVLVVYSFHGSMNVVQDSHPAIATPIDDISTRDKSFGSV